MAAVVNGRYYADDCLVRAATGVTTDNLGVTSQTLRTLHQFPDCELVGEDVICFRGAMVAVPGGDVLSGHADMDCFVVGFLASFPDAAFAFESAIVNRDPGHPVRIATRWSLTGTHSGFGHFGESTGGPVYVMGYSHDHLINGRVTHEWIVTDEVAIWKQIHAYIEVRAGA